MGGTAVDETTGGTDGSYHVRAGSDSKEPLSTVVVEALAAATGADATAVDFHLYDAIDFDALDSLYRHAQQTGKTWKLEFDVDGHDVIARSDGHVTVR